ncbi:hypothetical protein ABW286_23005 [Erwinia papayae]|uniref:CdiI C-terminal domain-containing protein n=1 Tax=Erwinia papayae TaxID=206499 RepID=A0ABV3N840_9GAMM
MFGILFKGTPVNMDGELVQPASIIIDEFAESLNLPLSYWNLMDYKKSWLKSLEEGLSSKTHSALAASMYDPTQTNFIFTWVLYFEDNDVYVHNNVVFLDEHQDFTPESINKFVEPRATHDEDGMKISEWNTNLKSITDFYHSLKD